jgi:cytochrome b561
MNKQRIIGDVISSLVAIFVGLAALMMSIRYLARPQGILDWSVQLCGATTVGIIIFFLCWGHFQKSPQPTSKEAPMPEATTAGNHSSGAPDTRA